MYLVFNFVDCAGNGCSQMFHTNMNMFHSVVGVWIVKDKGFLNFLMMVSKLFNLWSVTFNRSLKHKIIARVKFLKSEIIARVILKFQKFEIIARVTKGISEFEKDDLYLVDLEFLNLLFKGTIHFECDSNNFLSLLLNPWTNGVGLLSELESEIIMSPIPLFRIHI